MAPLLDPIEGADHREIGGAQVDTVRAANGRVKRAVYPPGFRWSTHMRSNVESDLCMHAHVGFLAQGQIGGEYADGCTFEFVAPQVATIEPCSSSSTGRRARRVASASRTSTRTKSCLSR